jgi:two-component system, response regulator YesN
MEGSMMSKEELCRVLIVDDEVLIRQGIKHYMDYEQAGFEIAGEASNGQEALGLIEAVKPHIILTDIVMPIMDGEELTRIVTERYPDIKIIVLSSYGEFDYVRAAFQNGAVDYILKPKLDAKGLLKVLQTAAGKIPSLMQTEGTRSHSIESIIEKLAAGYEVSLDQSAIYESFPFGAYYLLGIEAKRTTKAAAELAHQVKAGIQKKAPKAAAVPFFTDKSVAGILINMEEGEEAQILPAIEEMAASAPEAAFAFSGKFKNFSELGAVWKDGIQKLLPYYFYFPDKGLLKKEDLPAASLDRTEFGLEWFTEEFKSRNIPSALAYLSEHAASLAKDSSIGPFEFKAFLGNIIFNITVILGNMDVEAEAIQKKKYEYFKAVEDAGTAKEALEVLNRFMGELDESLIPAVNQNGITIKKIIEYMKEHYAEPITLTEAARHFHFNPSYLSSYFSAHNEGSFIEQLNKIRIEEASKLLLKGEATISEISGLVGFSDHSYFCRVFKKRTGLSPSQYKRKYFIR